MRAAWWSLSSHLGAGWCRNGVVSCTQPFSAGKRLRGSATSRRFAAPSTNCSVRTAVARHKIVSRSKPVHRAYSTVSATALRRLPRARIARASQAATAARVDASNCCRAAGVIVGGAASSTARHASGRSYLVSLGCWRMTKHRSKSTPSLPPSPEQRCVSRLFAEAMRLSDLSLIQALE